MHAPCDICQYVINYIKRFLLYLPKFTLVPICYKLHMALQNSTLEQTTLQSIILFEKAIRNA